jgi:dipeptidase E
MKYYLSSYKMGSEAKRLKGLLGKNRLVGYIPNALDFSKADPERRKRHVASDMEDLKSAGLEAELLDLKDYFGKEDELREKIGQLGGLWISGGNVFVLRQAMKLSGLDSILKGLQKRDDFLYGGYSAAGCVLSPNLHAYEIVDDPTDLPYPGIRRVIWKGLGLIDYTFLPHYESDHPESDSISREVDYCKRHNMPYRTLRDGEVIIIG